MPTRRQQIPPPDATPLGDFDARQQRGVSDEDILGDVAQQAFLSDMAPEDGNNMGLGTIEASPEEQQMLETIMDGIEDMIHGKFRDDILQGLASTPELWMNVATASQALLEGAYQKILEQGVDPESDLFFGVNGVIQSTVELVFELAEAAAIPGAEDTQQLDAAYLKTLQMIGEDLFENDDIAASEAQQLLIDAEFGDGVSDLADEEFELEGEAVLDPGLLGIEEEF